MQKPAALAPATIACTLQARRGASAARVPGWHPSHKCENQAALPSGRVWRPELFVTGALLRLIHHSLYSQVYTAEILIEHLTHAHCLLTPIVQIRSGSPADITLTNPACPARCSYEQECKAAAHNLSIL